MNARSTKTVLDELKCDDRTAWNTIAVIQSKRKKYKIANRQPRQPVDTDGYERTEGRLSKKSNPYSQVWSFLSRFGDFDTDEVGRYIRAAIRVPAMARFHQVMSQFAPQNFHGFTDLLETEAAPFRLPSWTAPNRKFSNHVCEFGLMVALFKQYYAQMYKIIGIIGTFNTLVGCGEVDRAARLEKQIATLMQTHAIPLYVTARAWADFLGEVIFGHPYGPAIMRAWTDLFLEKSAQRIERKRERRKDQRLNLQQGGINFVRYLTDPVQLIRDSNIALLERPRIQMGGPIPYRLDMKLQTQWKTYLQKDLEVNLRTALGLTRRTVVTTAPVTFDQCIVNTRQQRPTAARIRTEYRGMRSFIY